MGPQELMGQSDINCSSSSSKDTMKKWQMLISILLEITNQGMKSQWVKIFLLPQQEEDQLGNQNVNKKHHSEQNVKELDS